MVETIRYYIFDRQVSYRSYISWLGYCYASSTRSMIDQVRRRINRMIENEEKVYISVYECSRIAITYKQ